MKKIPRFVYAITALVLVFGAIAVQGQRTVVAIEPGMYYVPGNPSCASLNADPFFDNINSDFGFKLGGAPLGTFPLDGSLGGELTGGAPPDPNNSVTIEDVYYVDLGQVFDWAASLGIDAVIVKGGPNAEAYVYVPESYGDEGLHAPTNPDNQQYYGISHIEFCYDYELTAEKTANAEYTRTHTWDITKSVNPESQSGFAGDTLPWIWTVNVSEDYADSDFAVSGEITVNNPTPFTVGFEVEDYVDGVLATVDCPSYELAPGGSVVCTYSASLGSKTDGTNTATINSLNSDVFGAVASADYEFGDPTTILNGTATVTDSEIGLNETLTAGEGPWTFNANDGHTCSSNAADYAGDGTYNGSEYNLATVTGSDGQTDSDDATTAYACYALVIDKTAAGAYTEDHEWTITKSVSPTPQNQFAGLGVDFTWTIVVVESIDEYGFGVSGDITVQNPAPMEMVVSLADVLSDGTPGSIGTCTNGAVYAGGTLTIPANTTTVCGYTAGPGGRTADLNTATATLNMIDFVATDPIEWTPTVLDASVTIDDDQKPDGFPTTISDGATFTYGDSYTCSSNVADYAGDGTYQHSEDNTATLATDDGLTESSTATEVVNCYAPVIDKTADGTYDERHEWDVDKTVVETENFGFPGDLLDWTWTVNVTEDVYEENFDVAGTITVLNPAPMAMTVGLTDVLSDGTMPVISGCTNGATYADGNLTIPANTTTVCSYTANDLPYADDANAPDGNTATANLNGIAFVATDPIEYMVNRIRENATLTDTMIGLNESLTGHGQAGTYTFGPFNGDDDTTCSSNRADYFVDGVYTAISDTLLNWAYVYSDDALQDSDDATTTWTCNASFADIYKTTNGQPADPTKDISFALYSGLTQLEIVSTLGHGANLQFQTALVPGDGYTICEYPVPAGYTFEISVNGGGILTYAGPPGEPNPTGEIQCFDFTAEPSGTTVTFDIENSYPGGAPRTPGYWKNWNRCTGGNQAETADKLNDYLGPWEGAGVFLLDDLLPQTIGNLTIPSDGCQVGVYVLDSRWAVGNKAGKQASNDAAYVLARDLLAARLNQDAGACVPTQTWDGKTFEQILTDAQNLLESIGYDGDGDLLGPKTKLKAERALAMYLSGIINGYNNSEFCTGDPSH